MATLTIRGLDDAIHARLRVQAARHGRSMEAEVRAILTEQLESARERFAGLDVPELGLPARQDAPRSAAFE